MTVQARILGDAPVRLWGLSSRERLTRQLRRVGVRDLLDEAAAPSSQSVALLRADHVYDDRIVAALVRSPGVLLHAGGGEGPGVVAAHVGVDEARHAETVLRGQAPRETLSGALRDVTPDTLVPPYQKQLRKAEPAVVRRIVPAERRALEDRLFSGSYKGVTDLVTKWVWPVPARWVTRLCANAGVRPNHVTSLGALLAVAAGVLFAYGAYGPGLLLGWFMTFLDTVDGKLARVTITSSRFGHVLDHGTDLIHPPLWYIAWGAGLLGAAPGLTGPALAATLGVIVVGYIVGRLVEGAFHLWLGEFSIFCWQRVDSYFRLVTARRNPNLLLLSTGALLGRPDLGLIAVAAWTALSSAILLVRLAMAAYARATTGPLESWLEEAADPRGPASLATRLFAAPAER